MTQSAVAAVDAASDLWCRLAEGLAEVRACSPQSIRDALERGTVAITAKEAMSVAARIEEELDLGEVVTPDDFSTQSTRNPSGTGGSAKSPRGCMDAAEETTLDRIFELFAPKLRLPAR